MPRQTRETSNAPSKVIVVDVTDGRQHVLVPKMDGAGGWMMLNSAMADGEAACEAAARCVRNTFDKTVEVAAFQLLGSKFVDGQTLTVCRLRLTTAQVKDLCGDRIVHGTTKPEMLLQGTLHARLLW